MKSILITGATGFVGSHLLDYLIEHEPNANLYALRRLNSSTRNVEHIPEDAVDWITGDLCDPVSMRMVIDVADPSEIYHLGACSWVTPSWNMPSLYMQTNAIGSINLLEAVKSAYDNCRLPRILISCTPEEFGDVKPEDLPLTEDSPTHPVNPYAASKLAQDAICQVYHASYGIPIVRTRAFNHEGPRRDKHGALANFAYQIARIELGLQPPVVRVGNLEARRSWTHVKDMVEAYTLAMEKGIPGELYLIGSNMIWTVEDALRGLIARSMVRCLTYEKEDSRVRPTELHNLVGDCSKFHSLTGWSPKLGFQDILYDILEYWRKRVREEQA